MHHPKRAEDLPGLLALLEDGRHRVRVLVDRGRGLWDTASRAWDSWPVGATHHLVLQDDILPCRDFLQGVERALSVVPTEIVSFYCARAAQRIAVERGISWCTSRTISSALAVAMPVHDVAHWLSWCRTWVKESYPHDDARLSLWALHHGRTIYFTCPSLVEHIGFDRSLMGHRSPAGKPRLAAVYIGSQASALGIDWSRIEGAPRDPGAPPRSYGKGWRKR